MANEIWSWIDCGRAPLATGTLSGALAAFERAEQAGRVAGQLREVGAAIVDVGGVRWRQGDLTAALAALQGPSALGGRETA